MPHPIRLSASEWIHQRPFTHPDHILTDHHTLRHMVGQLDTLLDYPYLTTESPHTVLLNYSDDRDWFHRVVLAAPDALRQRQPLTIVGFFGQKREKVDASKVYEFDHMLIAEMPQHPGLFSYSSMALSQGNYANLVIFADGDARQQWSTSQVHVQAVRQLSPAYYRTVTIYNGRLPRGIAHHQELMIIRVKYYDYLCQPCWQAVRDLLPDD